MKTRNKKEILKPIPTLVDKTYHKYSNLIHTYTHHTYIPPEVKRLIKSDHLMNTKVTGSGSPQCLSKGDNPRLFIVNLQFYIQSHSSLLLQRPVRNYIHSKSVRVGFKLAMFASKGSRFFSASQNVLQLFLYRFVPSSVRMDQFGREPNRQAAEHRTA